MIEKRRKITFREELQVSKFRLWSGFIVSILLSLSLYLFFVVCRDFTRLLTISSNYNYLELNFKELFFYNLFYAILSLLVGQSYFLKIVFDKNKNIYEKRVQFKRKKIVHDQNVLIWFFLLWFIRTAGLTAFLYMNFNTEYPIDFYYDLNFYSEYKHLFILILLVLFFQSWQGFGFTYRKPFKKIIISAIIIVSLSFLFTKIKVINIENYFKNQQEKNIYSKEKIQIPKSEFNKPLSKWNRLFQIHISKNCKIYLKNKEINLAELIEEIRRFQNNNQKDYSNSFDEYIQINADASLSMRSLNEIRTAIKNFGIYSIEFTVVPSKPFYPYLYYQDHNYHLKDSNFSKSYLENQHFSKNQILLELDTKNVLLLNNKVYSSIEISNKIADLLLKNENYIIVFKYSEAITFSEYIKILDTVYKGYNNALHKKAKQEEEFDDFTLKYFPETILPLKIIDNQISTDVQNFNKKEDEKLLVLPSSNFNTDNE